MAEKNFFMTTSESDELIRAALGNHKFAINKNENPFGNCIATERFAERSKCMLP